MALVMSFSAPVDGGEVGNIPNPLLLALLAAGIEVPLPEDQPTATLVFSTPALRLTVTADAGGFGFGGGIPFGTIVGAQLEAPFEGVGFVTVLTVTGLSVPAPALVAALRNQDVSGLFGLLYGDDDAIIGNAGVDALLGHTGNDRMDGQGGNDDLAGGDGDDTIAGGPGDDLIAGDAGADSLVGEEGSDTLGGFAGQDSLEGGEGDDSLAGGADNDFLSGGLGADTVNGGDGRDVIFGNDGNDLIYGDRTFPDAAGRPGTDTLFGGAGEDTIFGLDGNDQINGSGGDDLLLGGLGRDWVSGGEGADSLAGGSGRDTFVFSVMAELGVGPGATDVILDFSPAEGDRVDLRAIDANLGRVGDQAFRLVEHPGDVRAGTALLSVGEFGGFAGTLVSLFDGSSASDPAGMILVVNVIGLTRADFIL